MTYRYLIVLIFSLLFFSGCSPVTKMMHQPEIDRAEALFDRGKNKEAAVIYQKLAALDTNQQYQLLAADALLSSGQLTSGKAYVDAIKSAELTPIQLNYLKLLQGRVLLGLKSSKRALTLLRTIKPLSLQKRAQISYYNALSAAYSSEKSPINSVLALTNLSPYFQSIQAKGDYFNRILKILMAIPPKKLSQHTGSSSKILQGWVALTETLRLNKGNLGTRLAAWRKAYPLHPVTANFLLSYEKQYQKKNHPATTVAVFLPKSGPYAKAAKVIKSGFMAAAKAAKKENPSQPKILYYDTEKNNIVALYRSVVKKGVKLIIGPLNKKHLKALVKGTKLEIPILALNHVDGLTAPNLYQFGLSPIDDAAQIANKAYQDGYKNALLLVPESKRGKRILGYFARHWQNLGAKTAEIQTYNAKKTRFSQTINAVAKKAASHSVDMIFMNAYPKQGYLLNPQLRHKKGTANLPIYATSHIYSGTANKKGDEKLNGVTFCDIPWVFKDVYVGNLSKKALKLHWKKLTSSYLRLLPLGIDAYQLINHLATLKSTTFAGATGRLTLGSDNRVNRELFCAQFIKGQPSLLNFSSEKMRFNP
jgi:outer membrane PBP1 activator LpoA protein